MNIFIKIIMIKQVSKDYNLYYPKNDIEAYQKYTNYNLRVFVVLMSFVRAFQPDSWFG